VGENPRIQLVGDLLICSGEGWLASARNAKRDAQRKLRHIIGDGDDALAGLLKRRRKAGLDLPYGEAPVARDPDAPIRPKGKEPDGAETPF
jgi:hypothetical protein